MKKVPTIELVSFRPGKPHAYQLAGIQLVTDADHPALGSYIEKDAASWSGEWDAPSADGGQRTYDGYGLIGDGIRRVVGHASASGYRLAVEGIGTYWVAPDGRRIAEVEIDSRCDPVVRVMTALGAPLILGMALQGIFCIHASVVADNGRLIAFVGESGRGKSTLARYLDETSEGQILRVIDDTLPISMGKARSATAWPHFPQLKLTEEEQPINRVPAEMPISALYVLEESRPDKEVRITPLRQKEATLALIQHTVAGRLFGLPLLEDHLAFCAGLVELVPVRRLVYPRTLDTLPFVKTALADEFPA